MLFLLPCLTYFTQCDSDARVLPGFSAKSRNTPRFTRMAHRREVPANTANWQKQGATATFPAPPSQKATRLSCESLASCLPPWHSADTRVCPKIAKGVISGDKPQPLLAVSVS